MYYFTLVAFYCSPIPASFLLVAMQLDGGEPCSQPSQRVHYCVPALMVIS
nr:MAG TPA: hypothetical protein [Caudoviricetes sp.]